MEFDSVGRFLAWVSGELETALRAQIRPVCDFLSESGKKGGGRDLHKTGGTAQTARGRLSPPDDYLRGFYDLLAMIQAPCFMLQYTHSAVVSVSDTEMQLLEWLHEKIRNDFEHFMPKTLRVSSKAPLCRR